MTSLADHFSRDQYPDAETFAPTPDDADEYANWLRATAPAAEDQLPTAGEIAAAFAAVGEIDPFAGM